MESNYTGSRGLASLREFLRKPPEVERCELCSLPLAARHQHLADPESRRLLCTCDACAILFSAGGETRYRRVPRDSRYLENFKLSDQAWCALAIPIGLAFIYSCSAIRSVIAVYPSPAGPTESPIDAECWAEVAAENAVLARMTRDVEALLVNRMNGARDYFVAPIDECYRLTGLVRKHWHGLSGGTEGWQQIQLFFDDLKARSLPERSASYAGSFV